MSSGIYIKTEEHRKKLSEANKGQVPWMNGRCHLNKTKQKIREARLRRKEKLGYLNSPETRKKISEALKGRNKGKHLSEETKEKIRKNHKGMLGLKHTEETKRKMSEAQKGEKSHNWGDHRSEERRRKMSEAHIGLHAGESHPNWQGGRSFEPYTPSFNGQLKKLIRLRDGYKCQRCGMPEIENNRKLDVHHIDYDKKNCKPNNLISLCQSCNSIVSFNREYWTKCFQDKVLKEEFGEEGGEKYG